MLQHQIRKAARHASFALALVSLLALFGLASPATAISFSSYTPVPNNGYTKVAPSEVVYNGNLYLFLLGTDGHVYYTIYNGLSWTGYKALGTDGYSYAPVATVVYNNLLYVVLTTTQGNPVYKTYNGSTWSSYQGIPNNATTSSNYPVSLAVFNGYLYLFITQTDGSLRYNAFNGFSWAGYQTVPNNGSTQVAPGVVVNGNYIYLFIVGVTNHVAYYADFDGNSWSGYGQVLPQGNTYAPLTATVFNNQISAFLTGTDGHIYYDSTYGLQSGPPNNNIPWSGFMAVPNNGTTTNTLPVTSVVYNNQLDVFLLGTDGHVYETSGS